MSTIHCALDRCKNRLTYDGWTAREAAKSAGWAACYPSGYLCPACQERHS